jgi:hypothetical protein
MRDTPYFPELPVRCVADNPRHEEKCHWSLASVLPKPRFPVALASLDRRVKVVDLTPDICEGGVCQAVENDKLEYRDEHHLTAGAAIALGPEFVAILKNAAFDSGRKAD